MTSTFSGTSLFAWLNLSRIISSIKNYTYSLFPFSDENENEYYTRVYQCDVEFCPELRYMEKEEFTLHMMEHHAFTNFVCHGCQESWTTPYDAIECCICEPSR